MPLRLSDTFMEQLVQESEGQTGKCILRWSLDCGPIHKVNSMPTPSHTIFIISPGADLEGIFQEAAMSKLRRNIYSDEVRWVIDLCAKRGRYDFKQLNLFDFPNLPPLLTLPYAGVLWIWRSWKRMFLKSLKQDISSKCERQAFGDQFLM